MAAQSTGEGWWPKREKKEWIFAHGERSWNQGMGSVDQGLEYGMTQAKSRETHQSNKEHGGCILANAGAAGDEEDEGEDDKR